MSITTKGCGFLNHAINALSIELHIPGYQFCGPGTYLEKRLARGDRGINPLDAACREHDIAYLQSKNFTKRHVADKIWYSLRKRGNGLPQKIRFLERELLPQLFGQQLSLSKNLYESQNENWLGLKMKKKPMKKRILSVVKRDDILPILLLLGIVGLLVGSAAGVAEGINDNKAAQRQLKELKLFNRVMEGHGVYLARYKRGRGVLTEKIKNIKKRQTNVKNTKEYNYQHIVQLQQLANARMRIPYFRAHILDLYAYYITDKRSTSKREQCRKSGQCRGTWYALGSVYEKKKSRHVF